jgi:Domain of unknown function (DUF4157)
LRCDKRLFFPITYSGILFDFILLTRMKNVRIIENSFFAKLAARKLRCDCVAITLGNSIHLHNASRKQLISNERWWKHELQHVKQFRQYGFLRFVFMYLLESIRMGYYNNRFEVEARHAELLP